MLEHIPGWLGNAISRLRAGADKLLIVDPSLDAGHGRIELRSAAFEHGARLPERFTADGAGVSPPLAWSNVPADAVSLALIVEDADAPTPTPLVHAIVTRLAPGGELAEGAISPESGEAVGRNSYLKQGWLPPDPPTGHGDHTYVFQIFALREEPDISEAPGRSELAKALAGRVIACGALVGTYSRT